MLPTIKLLIKAILKGKLDDQTRFVIMTTVGRWIFPKYRFKWYQLDWWDSDEFNSYLKRFNENKSFNTDRRWMLHQLLRITQNVEGDSAECGVYLGSSSYLIGQSNKNSKFKKVHYGFDSFEGLSNPTTKDGIHWNAGDLTASYDTCKKNLQELNVKLYKGWIPNRFNEISDCRFSFIHLDVDLLEPTRDSLEFFYPRMNEGAILVCDDYGCTTCPGATRAVDTFLEAKPEKMITLPDGGGFFIKGVRVGCRQLNFASGEMEIGGEAKFL